MCGGTESAGCAGPPAIGLSPRVRGNLARIQYYLGDARSIPACAGEPGQQRVLHAGKRVYPRVCGGTGGANCRRCRSNGLSPRVRGNPARRRRRPRWRGSIPACAGEPVTCTVAIAPSAVYPRVCGGTKCRSSSSHPTRGLSPRVRGNLLRRFGGLYAVRSIPACAGEPAAQGGDKRTLTVYPRVCGGTPKSFGKRVS